MPECDPPVWCPIYCCLVGAESSRTLVRLVLPGQLKKCSESNGILSFWFMVPQGSAIFWNSSRPWELRCKYLGGPVIKKPWVDWLMDKINNSSPGCPTWNEKRGGKRMLHSSRSSTPQICCKNHKKNAENVMNNAQMAGRGKSSPSCSLFWTKDGRGRVEPGGYTELGQKQSVAICSLRSRVIASVLQMGFLRPHLNRPLLVLSLS